VINKAPSVAHCFCGESSLPAVIYNHGPSGAFLIRETNYEVLDTRIE